MKISLRSYFNPRCTVSPPPEVFLTADWFEPILVRLEKFVAAYVRKFGSIDVFDWYRVFHEQEKLFAGKTSKAAVSEHCFAAALDLGIPEEFQDEGAAPGFIDAVASLDWKLRIGWEDYQKPNKKFTFFHVGWGFMIPFTVIRQYIDTYFQEPRSTELYHNINRFWHQGARW